jgi:hypothetical protein
LKDRHTPIHHDKELNLPSLTVVASVWHDLVNVKLARFGSSFVRRLFVVFPRFDQLVKGVQF